MNPSPLFSIIIPTYNSEEHIQACLDSISRQTYTDYEVLIIDGSSTDRTMEIVRSNIGRVSGMQFVSEKDGGIYDAMNKGIVRSKAAWLYFLGSNDKLYDEHVLSRIAEFAGRNELDVIYGNVLLERSGAVYGGEFRNGRLYAENISHQAIFLNRRVFDTIGNFKLQYRSNADWEHNFRWFFHPELRKGYMDIVIAFYSEDGFSSYYVDKQFRDQKERLFLSYAGQYISRGFRAKMYKFISIKERDSGNKAGFIFNALKYFINKAIAVVQHGIQK